MTHLARAALAAALTLTVAHAQDGLDPRAAATGVNDQRLERALVEQTQQAYQAESFAARNALGSQAVTAEASALAGRAAGISDPVRQAELERLFRVATRQAGEAFQPAFTAAGAPIAAQETAYRAAMGEAGGIAFRALGPALQLIEPSLANDPTRAAELAEAAIARASIHDVARLVAQDLKLGEPPLRGEALVERIDRVVPHEDYFRSAIDEFRLRAPTTPLDAQELRTLGTATRLANGTWKAGQVHRAAWEGTPKRITPGAQSPFNTFDALKTRMFESTFQSETARIEAAAARSPRGEVAASIVHQAATEGAFARVVFEVWKDVIELRKACAVSRSTPAQVATHEAARQEFQRRLASDRAAELSGLSIGQLLARGRALGVELEPGLTKAELLARLGGRVQTTAAATPEVGRGPTAGMRELLERELPRGASRRVESRTKGRRGR